MLVEKETVVGPGPARVLRALEATSSALTLADLGALTGLHENTLRAHLATLVDAGRVSRLPVRSGARGRPRWGYVVRRDEYSALARALVEGLAGLGREDAQQVALRGGQAWGRRVAADLDAARAGAGEGPAPGPGGPGERLWSVLEHTGFAPEESRLDGAASGALLDAIRLGRCPIIDAARDDPAVVCRVHQGMLEGALETAGPGRGPAAGPGRAGVELQPFAEGGACRVLLTHGARAAGEGAQA